MKFQQYVTRTVKTAIFLLVVMVWNYAQQAKE